VAANITAAEIQAIGGWDTTTAPDATLATFITIADAWLTNILATNTSYSTLATYTTAYANKGAVAKAAEIYFAAWLFASRPSEEDFTVGPITSKSNPQGTNLQADYLKKICRELLDQCGLPFETWGAYEAGGAEYHPDLVDQTNIDMIHAINNESYPFNVFGGDDNS
jgi:hypothetical protein